MTRALKKAEERHAAPTVVGWHGIYLETPPGWELAAVSGEMTRGNLRVDGPDGLHVRVKWQHSKKTDLDFNLKRYVRAIEKTAKERKLPFECNLNLGISASPDQTKRQPVFFSWRSEVQGIGLIWHCKSCSRVVIAQVDGPLKRNLTLLATQILRSLDDHAVDGCHTWGVYGLAAEIPADFALAKSKLLSGYIQLVFSRGSSLITLERWGLAEVVLRSCSLQEWARRQYDRLLKTYRCKQEQADVRGHDGLVVSGVASGLRDQARAAAMRAMRMKPADRMTGYLWHCADTNRICSVQVLHHSKEMELAEEVTASFTCHT